MAVTVLNGPVIEAGESLSGAIDLKGKTALRITMPGDWTDAKLTFQLSTDGEFYNDLFDTNGQETDVVVVPGVQVNLPRDKWGIRECFVKIRSGTREYPVKQPERREFALAVDSSPTAAEGPI